MRFSDDEIAKLYQGWDRFAHPNSPSGGAGIGGSRQSCTLGTGGAGFSHLPHPASPASKNLSHFDTIQGSTTNSFEPLKLDKLTGHVPLAVIDQIPGCTVKFRINTALRLAHFLAQCGHESNGFKATQENLNYSAAGLKKIFSKFFTDDLAASYARNPEKIAARVYAGTRLGNGDEASKDGYLYRGRGYIQLTGKSNYREFDKFVDDDILASPDLVSTKYPLLSAAWYWNSRSLNKLADKGSSDTEVSAITKKVNGGFIGLADRIKHFKQYYSLLKP
jgi:putative chitinase